MKLLALNEGIFAEPSGATALAGLIKAVKDKKIDKDEVIVVLVTGHGLKDPDIIRKVSGDAPTIEPKSEDFEKVLKHVYKVSLK